MEKDEKILSRLSVILAQIAVSFQHFLSSFMRQTVTVCFVSVALVKARLLKLFSFRIESIFYYLNTI